MSAATPWVRGIGRPDDPSPLRQARAAAGHTCATAAAIIGRTVSHYAKIERGETILSAPDAVKLCQAFGVTVESIVSPVDSRTVSSQT